MPGSATVLVAVIFGAGIVFNYVILRWELDVLHRHRLPWYLIFVPGFVFLLVIIGLVGDAVSAVGGARRDARRRR